MAITQTSTEEAEQEGFGEMQEAGPALITAEQEGGVVLQKKAEGSPRSKSLNITTQRDEQCSFRCSQALTAQRFKEIHELGEAKWK